MDYMQRILTAKNSNRVIAYNVLGLETPVRRYIVSSFNSRLVCTNADLTGSDYKSLLRKSISNALSAVPEGWNLQTIPSHRINIVNLWTGSEAWDLRGALRNPLGTDPFSKRNPTGSYIWSKRRNVGDEWETETYNAKVYSGESDTVLMAEIVASGASLDNTLSVLYDAWSSNPSAVPKDFILVTIGGSEAEKKLATHTDRIKGLRHDFTPTIIYLEGRFHVADKDTPLRIKDEGTDILALNKGDALVAPEFLIMDYSNLIYTLEKCRAYYGSRRDHDPLAHVDELREYWNKVLDFANKGWTLQEALSERSFFSHAINDLDIETYASNHWGNIEQSVVQKLIELHSLRWEKNGKTAQDLQKICKERLFKLDEILQD